DPVADYQRYVDGKPREDGVRDFLASRGLDLPEGNADDPDSVQGIAAHKNDALLRRIRQDGVAVFESSRRYLEAAQTAGLHRAVVSSSANTHEVLRVTGLEELVEAVVDGIRAKSLQLKGKPAP